MGYIYISPPLIGCMGLQMSKRPNTKIAKQVSVFCGPIWIWKKYHNIKK